MKKTKATITSTKTNRSAFGAVLIILGALFLLRNLDLIPFSILHYLFSWQGILIIIGSVMLASRPNKSSGLVLITIGIFFMFPHIWHIPGFQMRTWWPVILIVLGLVIMVGWSGYQNKAIKEKDDDSHARRRDTLHSGPENKPH